jgi:SAM-dependent methyltransferase
MPRPIDRLGGFSAEEWRRYLAVEAQEFSAGSQWPENQAIQKALADELLFPMLPPGPVLDLGCGDGWLVQYLRPLGWDAWGITINEAEVRVARERRGGGLGWPYVVLGDAHRIPFGDGEFGAVYARECLEHCIAPHIVLWEANRVLRDGGSLLLHTPSEQWTEETSHRWVPTWQQGRDMLAKTGFDMVREMVISDHAGAALRERQAEDGEDCYHIWLARQARRMPASWERGPWFPYMAKGGP